MPSENDGAVPIQFPAYPNGLQTADRKQAGILNKVMSRMLKPRPKQLSSRTGKRGIRSNQNVSIRPRKTKFY